MASHETKTLTAHCLCKAHIFKTDIPKSKLPLHASACHCDSCRHSIGALYSCDAPWPEPRANVNISELKIYHFSPKVDLLFCGTCSTPMFWAFPQEPERDLIILTGTIQNDPFDAVKIVHHIFVGDTNDGGASMWLRKPNADGTEAKRYQERSEGEAVEYSFDWPAATSLTGYEAKIDESVSIRCRCKGVDFVWHRGNYDGKSKEELPWFIDPTTHKPLAGMCGCQSCRLFGGVDVWNWAFGELEYISFADTKQNKSFPTLSTDLRALVDAKDPSVGTLTYYASSPDVQRYFCSSCSACIFYAADDRPEMVDVAVGVLEASDGARAEGFLSWGFGGHINRVEENNGGWRQGLFERVTNECEEWRIARGYPKNWKRVEREEAEEKAAS